MRNHIGYADNPPRLRWPGNAGLAVNFVLNYEEGSEYSLGDGDGRSETALIEVNAPRVPVGDRDLAAESMYEYGSRVGFWRLYSLFTERRLPLTIFAAALALERNRRAAEAIAETDWDIVAHGWRWIEHYRLDESTERRHIADAFRAIEKSVGRAPQGWYCRYSASTVTRRLLVEHGGYLYDSDAYNDDLPYWTDVGDTAHLVVPYSLVTNDAKFMQGGLVTGEDFGRFLIDTFDILHAESASVPKMMSVGMHPRVLGHPGRMAGLVRFLDHIAGKSGVWVCRRADIASHWSTQVPADEKVPA